MSSAVRPPNAGRVTMLMQTNLLMNSIRTNSVDMLKVQNQLTTGLKLSRPSDSPAEATTIMHLDNLLERQNQYFKNIEYADRYLAITDNALGQSVDLVNDAYSLALESVGDVVGNDGRQANSLIIDSIINSLITESNKEWSGSYVFGGQNVTVPPFEAYEGGVLYKGNLSEMQTRVSGDNLVEFSVNGNDVFNALSGEVVGIVDLNPAVTEDTLLADLNGWLNRGIRKGTIVVSDGSESDNIDLSGCVTVGDVINKINNSTDLAVAEISNNKDGLKITASGGNITVTEAGTGYTARDLGIYSTTLTSEVTGQDVDARLTSLTLITALDGGAGIDTILSDGLKISNSLLSDIDPIDVSTATNIGDIINAINNADIGARAELNSDGTGINVFNQLSGSQMTIGENDGGELAAALGIRSMVGTTKLADLNGGAGVGIMNDDDVEGSIQITDMQGNTYDVYLGTAQTIGDVIDLINDETGVAVIASLASDGNGIQLTDDTGGGGTLNVITLSENGFHVAEQLGFGSGSTRPSADTLVGQDVNPVMPEGLFSHLIALRDAMQDNDDAAITAAAEALDADRKNLSNYHGMVGSMMQSVQGRRTHMEDNMLATETLRSDIRDIDFTEAITRYQNLYTALQGNLMTGGKLSSMTLLDFLR